ncbi:MAG: hypothetical protein OXG64_03920 [Chloroflexi bacterium]|nr:hypothetical protein [Chloroflexota bacterium]
MTRQGLRHEIRELLLDQDGTRARPILTVKRSIVGTRVSDRSSIILGASLAATTTASGSRHAGDVRDPHIRCLDTWEFSGRGILAATT